MKKLIVLAAFMLGMFAMGNLYAGDVDSRVQKKLDMQNIKYTIDKNGNFKIKLKLQNGRTQTVCVDSITETIGNFEIREIWTLGYVANELDLDIAKALMQRSQKLKIGSWSIFKGDKSEAFVFSIQVSANLNAEHLKNLIGFAGEHADEIEKILSDNKDIW